MIMTPRMRKTALPTLAVRISQNARPQIFVFPGLSCVMETMTVETGVTRTPFTAPHTHAAAMSSSASPLSGVFQAIGSVTVKPTVRMARMNLTLVGIP